MANDSTTGIEFQSPTTGARQNVAPENWEEALNHGYKPTQHVVMYDKNGNRGMVSKAEMADYARQGYQTTPKTQFEKNITEGPRGVWNALKGMVPPDPTEGRSPLDPKFWLNTDKTKFDPTGPGTAYHDLTRPLPPDLPGVTTRGGSPTRQALYRGAAVLAPLAGGSAEGMEDAAARGDTSGVATQAAVPIATAIGAPFVKAGVNYGMGKLRSALAPPIEGETGQNAIAQQALKPKPKGAQQFQRDMNQGGRAYLQGAESQADLQAKIKGAKTEIWDPYNKGLEKFGEERTVGPDGKPTTYSKLEARRLELSAQLQKVRSKDPATLQTLIQEGKTPADLMAEEKAVTAPLDERFRQEGINPDAIRNTMGAVKGIDRLTSGRNTLSEPSQRYGLGTIAKKFDVTKPGQILPAVGEGIKDMAQGKPVWSGKPTDVNIKQGFQTGADKPSFRTTLSPKPLGPEPNPARPFTPPGPAEQVPTTGPGNNPAVFPDIPSGQNPSVPHAGGEIPNWPPKVPDWSSTRNPPPIPDANSTIPTPNPYGPPSTSGPPPMPGGLTDQQVGRLPTALRSTLSQPVPRPGSYSPGARAEVTPQGGPLPTSTPPTTPSLSSGPSPQPDIPSKGAPLSTVSQTPAGSTPANTGNVPPPTMPPVPASFRTGTGIGVTEPTGIQTGTGSGGNTRAPSGSPTLERALGTMDQQLKPYTQRLGEQRVSFQKVLDDPAATAVDKTNAEIQMRKLGGQRVKDIGPPAGTADQRVPPIGPLPVTP